MGEIKYAKDSHFSNCPLVWLNNHCEWRRHQPWPRKDIDRSKFHFSLQILQYNIPRFMSTEEEWIQWVSTIQNATVMGACELTLVRLFRKVIELKLRNMNAGQMHLFRLPMYTIRYGKSSGTELKETSRDTNIFLDNLLCGTDEDNLHSIETTLFFNLAPDCAWKSFLMHGFCIQKNTDSDASFYNFNGTVKYTPQEEFKTFDGGVMKLESFEMMCIYCGATFDGKLCEPKSIQQLYSRREQQVILEYLVRCNSFPSQRLNSFYRWEYWERSPSAENPMALHVEEVLSSIELHGQLKQRGKNMPLSHTEKLALWFSTSLNHTHSPSCIFRFKKRVFEGENCPVCIEDIQNSCSLYNCGHKVCRVCINDIRINVCPVCMTGTRKDRISVQHKD